MAYTPELSQEYSGLLRRLAWALRRPMTETLERTLDHAVMAVDWRLVCMSCRDTEFCGRCAFKGHD